MNLINFKTLVLYKLAKHKVESATFGLAINDAIDQINDFYHLNLPYWEDTTKDYVSMPLEIIRKVFVYGVAISLLSHLEIDDPDLTMMYHRNLNIIKTKYKIIPDYSNVIKAPKEFKPFNNKSDIEHTDTLKSFTQLKKSWGSKF